MTDAPNAKAAQPYLEGLRERARLQLMATCLQATFIQTHLQIADDETVDYALRGLVHHVREVVRTVNEIALIKETAAAGSADG